MHYRLILTAVLLTTVMGFGCGTKAPQEATPPSTQEKPATEEEPAADEEAEAAEDEAGEGDEEAAAEEDDEVAEGDEEAVAEEDEAEGGDEEVEGGDEAEEGDEEAEAEDGAEEADEDEAAAEEDEAEEGDEEAVEADEDEAVVEETDAEGGEGEEEAEEEVEEDSAAARVIPAVEGVPALFDPDAEDAKALTYDGLRTARGFNSKGLKLHKARNYAGASGMYIKALEQNPLHIVARYNLACAFAIQGDKARAIGLLNQLKALDCGQCRARLDIARRDKDFDAIREDAAFQAAVSGEHEVDIEALKKTTKLIHTRLSTFAGREQLYSYEDLNALIHPKHPALALMWGTGNGGGGPAMEAINQAGELFFIQSRELMNVSKRNGNPNTMTCKNTCCTLQPVPGADDRVLQKACYWVTSGGDIYLSAIAMRQDW